ncbi:hypothetical protein D3C76_668190 [compost metagenome]
MGQAHAFRASGGAGGVDQIGQVFGAGEVDQVVGGIPGVCARLQRQARQTLRQRYIGQQARLRQQQVHAAVFDHVGQALGRVIRVQRHITGAGLEDRHQADDHLRIAPHRQANPLPRRHTLGAQAMGELVGLRIELGVGQALVTDHHRQRIGGACRLLLKPLMSQQRAIDWRRRRTGTRQHHCLRLCIQQADRAQCLLWLCDELLQHLQQAGAQLADLRGTEPGSVETEIQAQAGADFDAQGQRVTGDFVIVQRTEGQARRRPLLEGFGHREVLEHQQAVEQRPLLPGPALNVVQRHVFELAQAQVQGLQVVEPLGHRLPRLRRGDDRQGVDEQPQLLLDARQRRGTPGNGCAEGHAGLAGVALQQQAPGALQQGVEGDFLLAGKIAQAL